MQFCKTFLLLFVLTFTIPFSACTKKEAETRGKTGTEDTTKPGLVNVIKNGKLANFQSTTIGNAFDSYKYLAKKEWKQSQQDKTFTIDFLGWVEPSALTDEEVKRGITGKGLNVKFVIESNGAYYAFMALRLEAKADGKIYTSSFNDMTTVLSSIYANKKIDL